MLLHNPRRHKVQPLPREQLGLPPSGWDVPVARRCRRYAAVNLVPVPHTWVELALRWHFLYWVCGVCGYRQCRRPRVRRPADVHVVLHVQKAALTLLAALAWAARHEQQCFCSATDDQRSAITCNLCSSELPSRCSRCSSFCASPGVRAGHARAAYTASGIYGPDASAWWIRVRSRSLAGLRLRPLTELCTFAKLRPITELRPFTKLCSLCKHCPFSEVCWTSLLHAITPLRNWDRHPTSDRVTPIEIHCGSWAPTTNGHPAEPGHATLNTQKFLL